MSAHIGPFDTLVAIRSDAESSWHGYDQRIEPNSDGAFPTCEEIARLIGADYEVQVLPATEVVVPACDAYPLERPMTLLGGGRQVVVPLTTPRISSPNPEMDEDQVQLLGRLTETGSPWPDLRVLGTVGADYRPIQNVDLARVLDEFMASAATYVTEHPDCGLETPQFETMGTLDNGRRFWAMIRMGGFSVAIPMSGGAGQPRLDAISAYLLVTTSHDGKRLASVSVVFVRVVCNNTLTAALDTEQRVFNIKHTGDVKLKLENVAAALDWLVQTLGNTQQRMQAMVDSPLTNEEAEAVILYFFGAGARQAWLRDRAAALWASSELRGGELAPAGTVWRFLQALTQTIEESQDGKDAVGDCATSSATARVSGDWRGVKYTPTAAMALCAGLVCDRTRVMKLAAEAAAKGKKNASADAEEEL